MRKIGGTTPCKADCSCTGARAARPGRGTGRCAGRPRWRTAGAGCTEEPRPALRGVTPTPASMVSIPPGRSPSGRSWRRSCARCAGLWRKLTGRIEGRVGPARVLPARSVCGERWRNAAPACRAPSPKLNLTVQIRGSFLAIFLCWRARRGSLPATGLRFWESSGIRSSLRIGPNWPISRPRACRPHAGETWRHPGPTSHPTACQ